MTTTTETTHIAGSIVETPEATMKACRHCGAEKPLEDFARDAKAKDGHRSTCKACSKIIKAAKKGEVEGTVVMLKPETTEKPAELEVVELKPEPEPEELTEKTCASCGETKPVDQFGRSARSKDGFRSYCKACDSAASQRSRAKRKTSKVPTTFPVSDSELVASVVASMKA